MPRGVMVFFTVPEEHQETFCELIREIVQSKKYQQLGANFISMDGPYDYDPKIKQDFLLQCRKCGATFKRPLELSEDAVRKGTPTKRCHVCGSWEFKKIPKKKN